MSRRLVDYVNVRNVFKNIVANTQIAEITFAENKDTLAVHLGITHDNDKLDYFFIHGNTQVCRFLNDEDVRVMTTNPENLERHIIWDIEDFMRGKTIA